MPSPSSASSVRKRTRMSWSELLSTMPTSSVATPHSDSHSMARLPRTRTRSPGSKGDSAGRGPLSTARPCSLRACFLPSVPSTCTVNASTASQTTPRSQLPPSPRHTTRVPGHVSSCASSAGLRDVQGSQTPCLPGKSTTAAGPSKALTRPRVPGGTAAATAALGVASRVTRHPGYAPARCRCNCTAASCSCANIRRACSSSACCSSQCLRNSSNCLSSSAICRVCSSASWDLSCCNCSSSLRRPSRSLRRLSRSAWKSLYTFGCRVHIPEPSVVSLLATPTRRIRWYLPIDCSSVMEAKSTV
mmetsp:Transcript_48691/g.155604  ORF Transcript_48691/g.155604 Transcript_48691/m.155604 type:complete len:303 (+) Transcript_48691:1225-2133(+)